MGLTISQLTHHCCCETRSVNEVRIGGKAGLLDITHEYLNVSNRWNEASAEPHYDDGTTVVLLGGTGVGKSNLGNFLLDGLAFESRSSQESVTTATGWTDGTWFGGLHPLRVVDCTGIGDTKGARANSRQWDVTIEVLMQIKHANALVLVMRAGRFTKFDKEVVTMLRQSFGPSFWKNLCVFCTGTSAKPSQLSLEREAPKIRRKFVQIERENGPDGNAMQRIQRMFVYAADLDPVLVSPKSRSVEFRFKPALSHLNLEELISLDLRVPPDVMNMNSEDFKTFTTSDPCVECWVEGNYFQLGLARLAAFKTDVSAMESIYFGGLERFAHPPADEAPDHLDVGDNEFYSEGDEPLPAALIYRDTVEETFSKSVSTSGYAPSVNEPHQLHIDFDLLESVLSEEAVVLAKGSFFVELVGRQSILPRREELPQEAFYDTSALIQGLQCTGDYPVPFLITVSYVWLSRDHPDPEGFHLQIFAELLKAFAVWHRISLDHIAIFWDWCCMAHVSRSSNDAIAVERALQNIYVWYTHSCTAVWLLSRVPENAIPFDSRGWPFFEKSITGLTKSASAVFDMGILRPGWTMWSQVLQDCKVTLAPPLLPDTFYVELLKRSFSQERDREFLCRKYGEIFRKTFAGAARLQYAGLHWGNEEAVRFSKLLEYCSTCKECELHNNDISDRGAKALEFAVRRHSELRRLSLWGNRVRQPAQESLLKAWVESGKPREGLEVGDQREPIRQEVGVDDSLQQEPVFVDPTASPSSRRVSPTRWFSGQGPSQMAELGARQVAFEARLHVAVNHISEVLCEVGDIVGGTPVSAETEEPRETLSASSSAWRSSQFPLDDDQLGCDSGDEHYEEF